jgi:hypothetical protein
MEKHLYRGGIRQTWLYATDFVRINYAAHSQGYRERGLPILPAENAC